ncbi:MAG: radical SAM protein [Bacillota bacterium]|nr:radical SAM protein [Bacillota bacterium]
MSDNKLLDQIFSIPVGRDSYIIYAPLKKIAFIGNKALINSIFDRCTENKAHDSSLDFLERLDFFKPDTAPIDTYKQSGPVYDSLILFPTNRCNLRCKYCYASSGEETGIEMNLELAKAAMGFLFKSAARKNLKKVYVGFHGGGEPTLNWNLIKESVFLAQKLSSQNNMPVNIGITSNGCWSREVCKFAVRNLSDATISFDGLTEVQNSQRPFANGRGSFNRVYQTLKLLDESDFIYGIRMTATADSVAFLSDSINYICENFNPRVIQVEPVFIQGRAMDNYSEIGKYDTFILEFIKASEITKKKRIQLKYSGARLDTITGRFCSAACRSLIITPDGYVTACIENCSHNHPQSSKYILGTFEKDGTLLIDRDKLNAHVAGTVDEISRCSGCFCKWHCAGDCSIKTLTGNAERCLLNRELTKYQILKKIEDSGGMLWNGKSSSVSIA